MNKMSKEEFIENLYITCECGYRNLKENVKRYGTCKGCKKVLDEKAKMKYEMYCRLKMWRNK